MRVKRYYEFFYSRRSAMDEDDIVGQLAPTLRRDVQTHLLSRSVACIPLFQAERSYCTLDVQLEVHDPQPLTQRIAALSQPSRSAYRTEIRDGPFSYALSPCTLTMHSHHALIGPCSLHALPCNCPVAQVHSCLRPIVREANEMIGRDDLSKGE